MYWNQRYECTCQSHPTAVVKLGSDYKIYVFTTCGRRWTTFREQLNKHGIYPVRSGPCLTLQCHHVGMIHARAGRSSLFSKPGQGWARWVLTSHWAHMQPGCRIASRNPPSWFHALDVYPPGLPYILVILLPAEMQAAWTMNLSALLYLHRGIWPKARVLTSLSTTEADHLEQKRCHWLPFSTNQHASLQFITPSNED